MPQTVRPHVSLDGNLLEFFANDPSGKPLEERTLSDNDFQTFRRWIETYRNCLRKSDEAAVLLRIGREMYHWLNGALGAMDRLLDDGGPPVAVEFRIPKRRPRPGNPTHQNELTFLDVPWELLAEDGVHLAGDDYTQFCPVRRIGNPTAPEPPSEFRLSAVFMAAEPRDAHSHLRYEAEETAIMTATGDIGMDLVVEESGALDQLRQRLAKFGRPDLLHLSCHGHNEPAPVLALEDERGHTALASPPELHQTLADHRPKLLFLSACLTAASGPGKSGRSGPVGMDGESGGDALVNSFAASMIQFGCPAVLGWAGSVSDAGATRFAEKLYGDLATSNALETAVARARAALLNPGDAAKPDSRPSRDWHLARLWLGPAGGAALCAGDRARRLVPHDRGHREFLDAVRKRVPVAGYAEFVGRRRQIQDVLREFRAPARAGVLIHGFGGQGKSSLAARIANRLGDHKTVVVFGAENETHRYRADKILRAVAAAYENPAVNALVDEHAPRVRKNPAELTPALRAILNGPCADPADGVPPMLLIVDDLEKVLVPPTGGGLHTVEKDYADGLCALIRAFDGAETRSRLLITSRYEFSLAGGLEARLLSLHLPPMRRHERDKQADAKLRVLAPEAGAAERDGRSKLFETVIEAARGNPRLQDLLFTLAVESPEACGRALTRMKAELAGTGAAAAPDGAAEREAAGPPTTGADTEAERALIGFFQGLAVRGLVELLRPAERDLLRASAVFGVPAPMSVFGALADGAEAAGRRLLSLTLWDRFEDLVNPDTAAAAVNGLARSLAFAPEGTGGWRIPEPDEGLANWVAETALPELFAAWGGADGKTRPYPADWQLAALGARAKDTTVLKATAKDAVTWLEKEFRYREAADLSEKSVAILEENGVAVPPWLYLKANEVLARVGKVGLAEKCIEKAVRAIREKTAETDVSDFDLASALLRHGDLLVSQGHIELALAAFEEAKALFQAGNFQKDTAIATGQIARILVNKGEVDEALKLHYEEMEVYEALGDRR
ncbi:MAG: CHAT domain-containing protein, partial [Desulfococcaceae bacterium]